MGATVYQFQRQVRPHTDLAKRHMGFCIQDVTRIAALILLGQERGENRHSTFVRDLAAAHHYNRAQLPKNPFNTDTLYVDARCGISSLFRLELRDAETRPRLRENDPWAREEIIQRILADTGDYITTITEWLDSQATQYRFRDYTRPNGALWLIKTSGMIRLKNSERLATECRAAINDFYNRSNDPAMPVPPSPRV